MLEYTIAKLLLTDLLSHTWCSDMSILQVMGGKRRLSQRTTCIADMNAKASDFVHLNVSGERLITVPRATLALFEDSMLGAMFSGRHKLKNDEQVSKLFPLLARALPLPHLWLSARYALKGYSISRSSFSTERGARSGALLLSLSLWLAQ